MVKLALIRLPSGRRFLPLPVAKLLAKFGFEKFARGGVRKFVYEDKGVGDLPTGEALLEESAQFSIRDSKPIFRDHDR